MGDSPYIDLCSFSYIYREIYLSNYLSVYLSTYMCTDLSFEYIYLMQTHPFVYGQDPNIAPHDAPCVEVELYSG